MSKFKKGDVVRFISHVKTQLNRYAEYKVNVTDGYGVTLLPINHPVLNPNHVYSYDYFEKVSDNVNNNVNGIIELNGVKYQVENIPGKGECLVPVKRTPKTGEVWIGIQGGVYVVTAYCESDGFELRSNSVFTIPGSAKFGANSLSEAIQKGLIK